MTDTNSYSAGELIPIGDVARIFGVTVPTVRSWEKAGKLEAIRTPGNHRMFRRSAVEALLSPASAQAAS